MIERNAAGAADQERGGGAARGMTKDKAPVTGRAAAQDGGPKMVVGAW